ncbi:amidohydrolase, partial [Rhizobiaceae sp. 2RAB30]
MTSRQQQFAQVAETMRPIRHDLHRHPEIGFQERRTASIVSAFLRKCGLEVTEQVGGTGVVGLLRGKKSGHVALGLRADMDALPIQETTGLPYASINPGRMHACGHDGHMAMLMGAAQYLSRERNFAGSLYFIFQPAEESGLGGAKAMLNDDFMRRFPCDYFFGLHNRPGLPLGTFMTNEGPI